MQDNSVWEEYIQIRYSSYVLYRKPNYTRTLTAEQRDLLRIRLQSRDRYTGSTTTHSRDRMRKALDMLLQITPVRVVRNNTLQRDVNFRIAFITLTIPYCAEASSNKIAYSKCLRPFLSFLCKTHNCKSYVWKLEFQLNGSVHYHLACDCFVDWFRIKDKWNTLLSKAGLLDEYRERHGDKWPNSTDVHSPKHVDRVGDYMVKYMSKSGDLPEGFKGRVWGCSANLTNIKFFSTPLTPAIYYSINRSMAKESWKVYDDEYFCLLKCRPDKQHNVLPHQELQLYRDYINNIKSKKDAKKRLRKRAKKSDLGSMQQQGLLYPA